MEINEMENRKTKEKIDETKVVLWKDHTIDNPLARLTKRERNLNY